MQSAIRTECVCPPIPIRIWDWAAWIDGTMDADWDGERYLSSTPIGHGATEAAAILDLMERLDERYGEDLGGN
jgi:hypothetical protein